jgi:hypothetical protein
MLSDLQRRKAQCRIDGDAKKELHGHDVEYRAWVSKVRDESEGERLFGRRPVLSMNWRLG